jgi:O-antigen ligase
VGSSAVVSAGLMAVNIFYLVYRFPVVKRLLRQASILEWAVVIVLWPVTVLFLLVLSGDVGSSAPRAFFVQINLLTLLLGSAVFVSLKGWPNFRRLVFAAAGITLFGMILNWLNPAFFFRLGTVASSMGKVSFESAGTDQISQMRRAAGFFIEANLTALSCNILMLALLARYTHISLKGKVAIIGFMLMLTAASGSRGGMLVNLIVSGLVLWDSRDQLRTEIKVTKPVAIVGGIGLVLLVALGAFGALTIGGKSLEQSGLEMLANRMRFWEGFGEGGEGDLLEDKSLQARLEAQGQYIGFISERPFLGYGPEGTRRLASVGQVEKMSHNLFFEKAFRYGVPYLLLILFVFFRTFQRGRRWRGSMPDNASVTLILVALLMAAGMVAGGVLESRAVVVVIGAILGQQYALRQRQLSRARQPQAHPLAQASRA